MTPYRPHQAIYRGGRWVDVHGRPVDQAHANAAWKATRPPGQGGTPHEHSVVNLIPPAPRPRVQAPLAPRPRVQVKPKQDQFAGLVKSATKYGQQHHIRPVNAGQQAAAQGQKVYKQQAATYVAKNYEPSVPGKNAMVDPKTGRPAPYNNGKTIHYKGQWYQQKTPGVGDYLGAFGSDLINAAEGLGPGLIATVRHPVAAAEAFPGQLKQAWDQRQEHPGTWALTALGAAGGALGALDKLGAGADAVSLARAGGVSIPRAIRSGLTRHPSEGGGLLRSPNPGTMPITLGDHTENIPLSRSTLYRPLQAERLRQMQVKLDAGHETRMPHLMGAGPKIQSIVTPAATVGRARRARQRVVVAERSALKQEQAMRVARLNKPEKYAINVVANAGHDALTNPYKAVQEQIKNHADAATSQDALAQSGATATIRRAAARDARRNRQYIGRLQGALAVLKNPSPRFQAALEVTRRGSEQMTAEKVGRDVLKQTTADQRVADQAQAAVGGRSDALPVGPGLVRAQKRVAVMQAQYDKALAKGQEKFPQGMATEQIPTPRSEQAARARLKFLSQKIEARYQELSQGMMTPLEKRRDQARRNRTGKGRRLTSEQNMADATRILDQLMHDQPDHPLVKGLSAQLDEYHALNQELAKLDEARMFGDPISAPSAGVPPTPLELDKYQRFVDRGGWEAINSPDGPIGDLVHARSQVAAYDAAHRLDADYRAILPTGGKNLAITKGQTVRDAIIAAIDRHEKAVLDNVRKVEAYQKGATRQVGGITPDLGYAKKPTDVQVPSEMPNPRVFDPGQRVRSRGILLKDAKERLAQLEATTGTRFVKAGRKETSFTGAPAPEGAFYFSTAPRLADNAIPRTSNVAHSVRASEYGIGRTTTPARHGVAGLSGQHFTGKSYDKALPLATDIVNHQLGAWAKFTVAEDGLGDLWNMAKPNADGEYVRTSNRQTPIRDTIAIKKELRAYLQDLEDAAQNPAESERFLARAHQKLDDIIHGRNDPALDTPADGQTVVPGVRWIDPAAIKATSVSGSGMGEGVLKAFDVVNSPARFAQLYTRPAYLLNLAGNVGMGAIRAGLVKYAVAFKKSWNAQELYGVANEAKIASRMGESRSLSYAPDKGFAHRVNRIAAEKWNRATDYNHRLAMFIAEAEREGFRTPTQMNRLLNDPKLEQKAVEITQRARAGAVDFNSLTPFEGEVMRRLVYFYPWVSRGSTWAVHAVIDHPLQTMVGTQISQTGINEVLKAFGNLGPMWQRLAGYIPVGKQHGGLQDVLNLSSVNTFGTAAQAGVAVTDTVRGLAGLTHGSAGADVVTPFLGLAGSSINSDPTAATGTGVQGLWQSTPLYTALRRGGVLGKPSKTFPETGWERAVTGWAGGGAALTGLSVKTRHTAYLKEQGKAASAPVLARQAVNKEREQTRQKAIAAGLIGKQEKLPKPVRDAYGLRLREHLATATISKPKAGATEHEREAYQWQALQADARLIVALGLATRSQVQTGLLNEWRGASADELAGVRSHLRYQFFGGKAIEQTHREINAAG